MRVVKPGRGNSHVRIHHCNNSLSSGAGSPARPGRPLRSLCKTPGRLLKRSELVILLRVLEGPGPGTTAPAVGLIYTASLQVWHRDHSTAPYNSFRFRRIIPPEMARGFESHIAEPSETKPPSRRKLGFASDASGLPNYISRGGEGNRPALSQLLATSSGPKFI